MNFSSLCHSMKAQRPARRLGHVGMRVLILAQVVQDLYGIHPEFCEHGRKAAYECIVPRAQNLINKRLRQVYKGSEELVKPESLIKEYYT